MIALFVGTHKNNRTKFCLVIMEDIIAINVIEE
jgi:hypothetical protein